MQPFEHPAIYLLIIFIKVPLISLKAETHETTYLISGHSLTDFCRL